MWYDHHSLHYDQFCSLRQNVLLNEIFNLCKLQPIDFECSFFNYWRIKQFIRLMTFNSVFCRRIDPKRLILSHNGSVSKFEHLKLKTATFSFLALLSSNFSRIFCLVCLCRKFMSKKRIETSQQIKTTGGVSYFSATMYILFQK